MGGCEEMMIPHKFPVWLSRTVEVKQELEHKEVATTKQRTRGILANQVFQRPTLGWRSLSQAIDGLFEPHRMED